MADVPREPSFYYPSRHARIRKRERDISWSKVSETVQEGDVRESPEEDCKLFVREYDGDEYPLGVVCNVDCGEIITVEWRK